MIWQPNSKRPNISDSGKMLCVGSGDWSTRRQQTWHHWRHCHFRAGKLEEAKFAYSPYRSLHVFADFVFFLTRKCFLFWNPLYCNCIMLDFVHPNLRKGVGQSFLTSRFARNEIDFFSPLNSKVTQLVNCTWKLPEPLEDAFDLCIFVKINLSHCLFALFLYDSGVNPAWY